MTFRDLNQVNNELIRLGREIDDLTRALIEADTAASEARYAAYAKAEITHESTDGAQEYRKHHSRYASLDLEERARIAELQLRTIQRRLDKTHATIDLVRSIGANIKSEQASIGAGYGAGA